MNHISRIAMLTTSAAALTLALPSAICAQPIAPSREAGATTETPSPESVVRALIEAGNRADADAWLALFHPNAKQFRKSESDDRLADRPSARATDSASRAAYYRELFARPERVRAEIVEMISLGELVMARGIFHMASGPLHTLTVYRVRDGLILNIWDVEQISRPECIATGCSSPLPVADQGK